VEGFSELLEHFEPFFKGGFEVIVFVLNNELLDGLGAVHDNLGFLVLENAKAVALVLDFIAVEARILGVKKHQANYTLQQLDSVLFVQFV